MGQIVIDFFAASWVLIVCSLSKQEENNKKMSQDHDVFEFLNRILFERYIWDNSMTL